LESNPTNKVEIQQWMKEKQLLKNHVFFQFFQYTNIIANPILKLFEPKIFQLQVVGFHLKIMIMEKKKQKTKNKFEFHIIGLQW